MENNVGGEDSDSIGNTRNTRSGFTLPAKEKRKPFFKKVRFDDFTIYSFIHSFIHSFWPFL